MISVRMKYPTVMYFDIEKLPQFSNEMQSFRKEVLGPNISHLNFVIFKNTEP